mgnify:CR=1 FL=1
MALSTEEVLAGLAELINDETGISTDSIVVNAEEKFDVKIPDEEVKNLKTVGDAVTYIVGAQG